MKKRKKSILKKVESLIEEKPAESNAPQEEVPLSPRRKQALITYLALLLALAFLVVAVSLFIQHNRTVAELQDANQALARAGQLQQDNQALQAQRDSLTGQVNELQSQLDQANATISEKDAQIAALQAELEAVNVSLEEADTEHRQQTDALNQWIQADEALLSALQAEATEDEDGLDTALALLKGCAQFLSPQGQTIYNELLNRLSQAG